MAKTPRPAAVPAIRNPLPQLVPGRVDGVARQVRNKIWEDESPLEVEGGPVNDPPIELEEAEKQPMSPVAAGEHFGDPRGSWKQRWFKVEVPKATRATAGRRFFRWQCQGETTLYLGGQPYAGLDVGHREVLFPDKAATVWLDCGTWQTGIWVPGADRIGSYGLRFDGASTVARNDLAWQAHVDLDILQQLVTFLWARDGVTVPEHNFGHRAPLEKCSPLLRRLLRGLDDACDAWVHGGLEALRKATTQLIEDLPAEHHQPVAALCGHAHLDLVWLWPEAATRRKAVHTFATQLRLMEQYDEFRFVQSQPAEYRMVEEQAPGLMEQVKARIASGQWEVMGGFEVEPDNNMPCGEALARSLEIGQRKTIELTGKPSPVCWIPDVFGYSGALPTVLALGRVKYFYTSKLTWSSVTKFPYTSFIWRGHDGSEVITHLCTTGYNGHVKVETLINALDEHRQADVHPAMLMGHGYGDGGGGTTGLMIEKARRIRSLAGCPKAEWQTTERFFDDLAEVRDRLPVYQGELYLEYHRGVLTTQSEHKRLYRRAERALQAHEAAAVATGGQPIDEADWRRTVFMQFHDALPGSSIERVYEDLNPELETIGDRQLAAATETLAGDSGRRSAGSAVVFNPLPVERIAVVDLPDGSSPAAVKLGPLQSRVVDGSDSDASPVREVSARVLDNGIVRATFSKDGRIESVTVDGELLPLTGPDAFVIYHDAPHAFPAWEIDHYTLDTGVEAFSKLKLEVVSQSPARAVLRGSAKIGEASSIAVDYILDAGARHLRVEATVGWHETLKLLKYHVRTSCLGRTARFGAAYGQTERPQLRGMPQDEAQWESCGNRWAAVVDDAGRGVAVLTEAKYGFSCREGDLGLSLLRAPKDPDPNADMGEHRIRWAIGRHAAVRGGAEPTTAEAADALFTPAVVSDRGGEIASLFRVEDAGSLVPCWVKPEDDGFTLRLHEVSGRAGKATVVLRDEAASVKKVDFFGDAIGDVEGKATRWRVDYRPYQVVGLRIRPA